MANFRMWTHSFKNAAAERKEHDFWQAYHEEEEPDYGWLKKLVIAVIIFGGVYGAHASDTAWGRSVVAAAERALTTEMDYVYWLARGQEYSAKYFPNTINWGNFSFVENAKEVLSKPADPLLYMSRPAPGDLKQAYGRHIDPVSRQEIFHEGIDIKTKPGENVRAAAPGKIKLIQDNAALGKMVVIEHGQDTETIYSYLGEVLVKDGEMVSQRQLIARVGKVKKNNPDTPPDEPVLYFEVRKDGVAIDPLSRIQETKEE